MYNIILLFLFIFSCSAQKPALGEACIDSSTSRAGVCSKQDVCADNGNVWVIGACAGDSTIRCCLNDFVSCRENGRDGWCTDKTYCDRRAGYVSLADDANSCPGDDDHIECCVEKLPELGEECRTDYFWRGTCREPTQCVSEGFVYDIGKCAGGSDVRCCIDRDAPLACALDDGRQGQCADATYCTETLGGTFSEVNGCPAGNLFGCCVVQPPDSSDGRECGFFGTRGACSDDVGSCLEAGRSIVRHEACGVVDLDDSGNCCTNEPIACRTDSKTPGKCMSPAACWGSGGAVDGLATCPLGTSCCATPADTGATYTYPACGNGHYTGECSTKQACADAFGMWYTETGASEGCAGFDEICCMPAASCALTDGRPGVCLESGQCDKFDGVRVTGRCLGPAGIQCCTKAAPTVCEVSGVEGSCTSQPSDCENSGGTIVFGGGCSTSNSDFCCLPPLSCASSSVLVGKCQSADFCALNGGSVGDSSICPGADTVCCEYEFGEPSEPQEVSIEPIKKPEEAVMSPLTGYRLSAEQLHAILNRFRNGAFKMTRAAQLVPRINRVADVFGISASYYRFVYFLAIIIHESDYFKTWTEYSDSHCQTYDGGCRYKGRGAIQLTHASNYKAVSVALGRSDIYDRPEVVATDELAFVVSAVFWESRSLSYFADKKKLPRVARYVNGCSSCGSYLGKVEPIVIAIEAALKRDDAIEARFVVDNPHQCLVVSSNVLDSVNGRRGLCVTSATCKQRGGRYFGGFCRDDPKDVLCCVGDGIGDSSFSLRDAPLVYRVAEEEDGVGAEDTDHSSLSLLVGASVGVVCFVVLGIAAIVLCVVLSRRRRDSMPGMRSPVRRSSRARRTTSVKRMHGAHDLRRSSGFHSRRHSARMSQLHHVGDSHIFSDLSVSAAESAASGASNAPKQLPSFT